MIGQLRVSADEEEVGLNYSEHNAKNSWLELLFSVSALSKGEAELSKKIFAEHGSKSGMIASLMNQFLEKLSFIIFTIRSKSDQLNLSARELSAGSQNISNNVQEQSAIIEEVVHVFNNSQVSFLEILKSLKNYSEIAGLLGSRFDGLQKNHSFMNSKLEYISTKSVEFGKIAKIEFEKFIKTITKVNDIKNTSSMIKKLVTSIVEISKKLKLLSLNASIEASRSSESSGQGFSVVAEEINKLSLKSSENAKNASAMLVDIQELLNEIINSFTNSTDSFKSINSMLNFISEEQNEIKKMSEINQESIDYSYGEVKSIMKESKNIEDLISQRLDELKLIFGEIDSVNHSIADLSAQSEELSSAGEFLKDLSNDLHQIIFKFKLAN